MVPVARDVAADGFSIQEDMKSYEIIYKEHAKEYEDYYKVVREKIVQKLKYNYRYKFRDGNVDMSFVLNCDGTLSRIDVDLDRSTTDRGLIDITVLSLRQASPFPPFPKELPARKLPFGLMVAFKKQ
ncbi:MAG: hypothetical protein PHI58_07445 [Candidatus Omnitrophica bacterium]|nr:hypothetical protein [Candidatus Omnitrophota bacterium]